MATVIGSWAKSLRANQGLTQQELASRAGVSLRTIQNMEAGKPTRPPTRRRVLQVLGLQYDVAEGGWHVPT